MARTMTKIAGCHDKGKAVMVEEEKEEDPPFVTENVKKLTLKTGDGKVFKVEEAAMVQSETIKNMIEDGCADVVIPIPNLTGEIFAKIVEYCNKHVGEKKLKKKEKEELEEWDDEFVDLDRDDLFNLLSAAMYLNIESLVDLAAQEFADMIKNLPIEKVREIFGIENDFTKRKLGRRTYGHLRIFVRNFIRYYDG
ncbi:hypothetical protein AQUCO_00200233v1 [Aquilegia coerulea]|uniref:SKP1-like protein n=1 Tax=Aquilegia coerulea TaxID=218851 RepID=A0A2G5F276_AQUCA|nr:hypothetical protein AQUCO_00200233v1 [Aquilegia coerulea]